MVLYLHKWCRDSKISQGIVKFSIYRTFEQDKTPHLRTTRRRTPLVEVKHHTTQPDQRETDTPPTRNQSQHNLTTAEQNPTTRRELQPKQTTRMQSIFSHLALLQKTHLVLKIPANFSLQRILTLFHICALVRLGFMITSRTKHQHCWTILLKRLF